MTATYRIDDHGFFGVDGIEEKPSCNNIGKETGGLPPPEERWELLRAIEYLKTREDNWNGFGATAPSHTSLQTAENFINELPFGLAYPDRISPDMEATVSFAWKLKGGDELHMMIDDMYIFFSKIKADNTIEDLAELKFVPGGFFPKEIRDHLPPYTVKKNAKRTNSR